MGTHEGIEESPPLFYSLFVPPLYKSSCTSAKESVGSSGFLYNATTPSQLSTFLLEIRCYRVSQQVLTKAQKAVKYGEV